MCIVIGTNILHTRTHIFARTNWWICQICQLFYHGYKQSSFYCVTKYMSFMHVTKLPVASGGLCCCYILKGEQTGIQHRQWCDFVCVSVFIFDIYIDSWTAKESWNFDCIDSIDTQTRGKHSMLYITHDFTIIIIITIEIARFNALLLRILLMLSLSLLLLFLLFYFFLFK